MKLSLTQYTVQYEHQSKKLLQNFSFECLSSGLYLLHGVNGAGKSTLFASLQGYSLPAKITGTMHVDGQSSDITSGTYKNYAHKNVGMVPQKYDELLAPQFSVRENLAIALFSQFPSVISSLPSTYIPSIIEEIGIPLDTPVEQLSGGQRQIIAIMMALQKSRSILLLDEPTATLDPANTALVMNFLVRLYKETGILILMICHDLDLQEYTEHKPIVVK